ncbi:MAG: hypothetical protein IJU82_05875 [Ruminiclostridium sp.]|nr:hypothetical protein [Ruminiclostridium sp.]
MINGFRKEMMFFARGGRLVGLILVMLGLALMSPLMFGSMSSMMQTLKDTLPDDPSYTQMIELYSSFSAADMIMYNVTQITGIGAIVILFLFKGAAGGEQKKRSVMIPQCAGLTPEKYVIPKFLLYPFIVFAVTFISMIVGAWVSVLMFPGDIRWDMVILCSVCTGVYLAFSTVMQFCIGLCTGRSNTAVVAVILLDMFLPSILAFFRVDRFNPFALSSIATNSAILSGESANKLLAATGTASTSNDVSMLNVAVSLGTALVISVLLFFLTIFTLHTKEVHNEGDEPVL